MFPNTVIGSVAGTGAALNVVLGFKPDYVLLINETTGARLEWFRGMADVIKTVVAGTVTTPAGLISAYEGALGEGFTVQDDDQVNVAAETIRYLAVRSAPGAQ